MRYMMIYVLGKYGILYVYIYIHMDIWVNTTINTTINHEISWFKSNMVQAAHPPASWTPTFRGRPGLDPNAPHLRWCSGWCKTPCWRCLRFRSKIQHSLGQRETEPMFADSILAKVWVDKIHDGKAGIMRGSQVGVSNRTNLVALTRAS